MIELMQKLPSEYYIQADVVHLARDMLGKVLCVSTGNTLLSGVISETEAYAGETDKASHAFGGRRTGRTEVMYSKGGVAYIYLCYGIHSLFNVVTGPQGTPHAVLVRGVVPLDGLELMGVLLGKAEVTPWHTDGPGKLTKALGLHYNMSGLSLTGDAVWIEERGIKPDSGDILTTPRIGVGYAGEDAALPYRFLWKSASQMSFSGYRSFHQPSSPFR